MQDASADDSTFQLVLDQLEELVVTVVEEIRQRPGVAVALFAGVLGALVGSRLAMRRRRPPPTRVARGARNVGDAAELLGIGMRLLQNPIVRGMLFAALARQLRMPSRK
jgi:hypothetical protein